MADRDAAAAFLGIKPTTTKMMIVDRHGNTMVREFPQDRIPDRWLRNGVELKPGDVVPQSTSLGRSQWNITKDAAAGTMTDAAAYAPMMIPGAGLAPAAARVGAGFLLGTAADAGARGLRGQQQSLEGSVRAGGLNAAGQTVGEVLPPVFRATARPMAKRSLGNAIPGMEQTLLEARTPVSTEGMAMDDAFIAERLADVRTAIDSHRGQFSSAQIRRALRSQRSEAHRSDLLSNAHENALTDALDVMQSKMGGGNKITQSKLVGVLGQALPPTVTRIPSKRLMSNDVEDINHYAEKQAKQLYEARVENRDTNPSALESAYKDLATVTNGMLNKIPGVGAANMAIHTRIGLRDAKFDASKRSSGGPVIPAIAALEAARTAHGMSHNPWISAASGLSAAGLAYGAGSPAGLSKMAFAANSPLLERVMRGAPRIGAAAVQDATRQRRDK